MCRQVESKETRGSKQKKKGMRDRNACREEKEERCEHADEREMKGEWQRCRKTSVLREEGQELGSMGNVGRFPVPPLSMNRRYVPKSVLPVTSWLLNNGEALGAT